MRGAVFFDRDGVLNVDVAYAHRPEQIIWTEGAMEAVRLANDADYLVFVVTNQAGVARGLYRESDVQDLHQWMKREFEMQGATIDAFAYCPHHPTEGKNPNYRIDCECRKPKPGMLLTLMQRFQVNPSRSFLIGDKDTDVQAAKAAGMRGYIFTSGNLAVFTQQYLLPSP
jgi:D-glycero-D-manno-heptose 1,7-bisphosphate phosphatase